MQAIDKATEKKQMYEQKLGVKLSPRAFSESGVTAMPEQLRNRYVNMTGEAYRRDAKIIAGSSPAFAAEANADEAPTSFGELVFVGRVNIEYTVEGK
jgi:hypothetical protein